MNCGAVSFALLPEDHNGAVGLAQAKSKVSYLRLNYGGPCRSSRNPRATFPLTRKATHHKKAVQVIYDLAFNVLRNSQGIKP